MPFVGDIGTEIDINVQQNGLTHVIESGATLTTRAQKPSGLLVDWTPELIVSGTMRYVTIANDLDEHGVWYLQGFVAAGATNFATEIGSFRVKKRL